MRGGAVTVTKHPPHQGCRSDGRGNHVRFHPQLHRQPGPSVGATRDDLHDGEKTAVEPADPGDLAAAHMRLKAQPGTATPQRNAPHPTSAHARQRRLHVDQHRAIDREQCRMIAATHPLIEHLF